jgi:hypothetical protein
MPRLLLGTLLGVVFGGLAVAMMLPFEFPDKRRALWGAFVDRLGIGIVLGAVQITAPPWLAGIAFGLLLSAPGAIITKAWKPILGFGAVGGALIGLAVHQWGR